MAEIAVVILKVIGEVATMAEEMKGVGQQADRLIKRLLSIEKPVQAVQAKNDDSVALSEVLSIVQEARDFLSEYHKANRLTRAFRRNSHAEKFADISGRLTEQVQALHFNVVVSAWASEDKKDQAADLEQMLDMFEEMEFNRRGNHDEVMRALEGLRQAESRTLTRWREIDCDKELKDEGHLGTGGFGTVRLAKWNDILVAVKYLTRVSPKRDLVHDLRREVAVHIKLRFEFIVHLYGASTVGHSLCLVMERAPGGNLRDYLCRHDNPLSHAMQAALLYDIARGMKYLHHIGVLHRDLKSANVLVFTNDRLKLCDFGLAKLKEDGGTITSHRGVGTAQWMSPEELDDRPSTPQGDVYSFGMVCFEVATRREPFPGKTAIHVINAVGVRHERPQLPMGSKSSLDVVVLMEKCWQHHPNDRPAGFDPVVVELEKALRSAGGDPRDSPGGSHNISSNITGAGGKIGHTLNHSPGRQSAPWGDKGTSTEDSHFQTTTVETFRGETEDKSAPHASAPAGESGTSPLPRPSTAAGGVVKRQQVILARGLIALLTPEDDRKGGHPWVFSGLKPDETLLVKTLTVWGDHNMIKAIKLTLSDDWTAIEEGRPEDDNEVLSFTFFRGETIVRMSTWTNGLDNGNMQRFGGLEFETSKGRSFSASGKSRGRKYAIDVGCGIVVGAHGRRELDGDSFSFIFVQKAKSVELRELSYPDPQTIDISIADRFVDDGAPEHNGMKWATTSAGARKVAKRVTNVTTIRHYTWRKTFESSVEASSLTLKGNLARLSFKAGKWALRTHHVPPVFFEGITDAREEIRELHFEAPATDGMTAGYRKVMDEASCIVPFQATMFITTQDGGVIPLRAEGELSLVVFGNARSVLI